VRVLIAEDSILFAEAISDVIRTGGMQVIGIAMDGRRAVEMCAELAPDLITMDVRMPVMDGLQAIEEIMAATPTPILVMTADPRGESGEMSIEALRRGALDVIAKPLEWPGSPKEVAAFQERVRLLATIRVVRHVAGKREKPVPQKRAIARKNRVIGIATSTGGPPALAAIFQGLSADFPSAIVVTQHIAEGFAVNLAKWLNSVTPLPVRLARDGERVAPGVVLLAPDHAHLTVTTLGTIALETGPPVDGHRPSCTRMLQSLAKSYGRNAVGLVLTGMGRDGAAGLAELRAAGGITITQDEASSAVFGMPKVAAASAQHVLSLDELPRFLETVAR